MERTDSRSVSWDQPACDSKLEESTEGEISELSPGHLETISGGFFLPIIDYLGKMFA